MVGGQSLDLSGAIWIKSTRSSAQGPNCVEVARNLPGVVAIRDSKDPHGPALVVPASDWRQFTHAVKRGTLAV
ncbi:MAG TPA: DUF397 domain-containing protein [Streptosporangiaceae bacterium]